MSVGRAEEQEEFFEEEFHAEEVQIHEDEDMKNKQILEEFMTWERNAPFLYDLIITRTLVRPSLTVQWLPSHEQYVQKVLFGTHTPDGNPNYLTIAQVHLPPEDAMAKSDDDDSQIRSGSNKVIVFSCLLMM